MAVGEVVLLIDHQLLRALWPVGTVAETYAGADGRIRTAKAQERECLRYANGDCSAIADRG